MTVNRYTRKLLSSKVLNPTVSAKSQDRRAGFEVEACEDNKKLLDHWHRLYDALADVRAERLRCKRYLLGNQWGDTIIDPDDPCHQKRITEEEYMKRKGLAPLTNNLIMKVVTAIMGAYRSNRREPMAISRDSEESIVGDMMSVAMQYVYQINETHEMNAHQLKEALFSGFAIAGTRYTWNRTRRCYEVKMTEESLMDLFCDGDLQDIRMEDLHTIGFKRDYTADELIKDFAKSPEDAERILGYYQGHARSNYAENPAFDSKYNKENDDFFNTSDPSKYRVIEGWRLEGKWRYRYHDTMQGITGVCELSDEKYVIEENTRRALEIQQYGGNAEDAAIIKLEKKWDEFWVGRYLTPTGEELLRVETPFDHLSHPYTIRAYPMIDGEVHSLISNIIPQQRHINRYITMMDYIRQCSAKGVMIFPSELVPKGSSEAQVADAWTKPNGIIFADMRPGSQMPQQFNSPTVNSGDTELLNIQMQLLEDISGVHAAMVGKSASASTPSSLYAQEAQNASNNLLDVIEWFDGFVRARDYKMMKVIQQFYDEPRYINLAGHEFSEAAKFYNPEKIRNSEMETAISEATATPAYRMILAQTLQELLQQGFIDVKMFLKNSKLPFADRLISQIESREAELAQQQQAAMPQGNGQPGAPAIAPDQEEATNPTFNDKTAQQQINQALSTGVSPTATRG